MIKSRNVIEITGITELKFRTKNQGGEKYMYKRKSVENQKKKIVTVLIGMFLMFFMVIISGGKNVYAANRPLSDGYYRIQSGNSSSRVLDINSASLNNGANLEIYQRNGGTNQIFYVQYRGYGYYSIRALHSGKYLHKDDGGNGTNVHQWENYNTSNAQWALEKSVGSYYYVRNRATGKYLDNANGSTALGNNVGLYYQNYTNAQRWKFIRVSKPAFTLKVTNNNAPTGFYWQSELYRVSGTVASNYPVTKMVMDVYDSNGRRTYAGREGSPNQTDFRYQFTLDFSKLQPGNYYYRMTAYNTWGQAVESRKYNFTVLRSLRIS